MRVIFFIVILFMGLCVSSCAIGEGDALDNLNKGTFVAWTTLGVVFASDDGVRWRQIGSTGFPNSKIVYNGSYFVSGIYSSSGIVISSNLSNWTYYSDGSSGFSFDAVLVDNIFYFAGNNGASQQYIFRYDGIQCFSVYASGVNGQLTSIAYGNGRFVAVGFNVAGNNVYSGDGSTWTGRDLNYMFYNVQFANGHFIAVGDDAGNSLVISSEDGSNWTANLTTPVLSGTHYGVAYGGGCYVAVGSNNRISYSENGSFWSTYTTSLPSITLYGIVYGKRAFIAVGTAGYIYRSEDGINWETVYSGSVGDFQGVTLIHNYSLDD